MTKRASLFQLIKSSAHFSFLFFFLETNAHNITIALFSPKEVNNMLGTSDVPVRLLLVVVHYSFREDSSSKTKEYLNDG